MLQVGGKAKKVSNYIFDTCSDCVKVGMASHLCTVSPIYF